MPTGTDELAGTTPATSNGGAPAPPSREEALRLVAGARYLDERHPDFGRLVVAWADGYFNQWRKMPDAQRRDFAARIQRALVGTDSGDMGWLAAKIASARIRNAEPTCGICAGPAEWARSVEGAKEPAFTVCERCAPSGRAA